MDDDGLIFNFATTNIAAPKASVAAAGKGKSQRWRDRVKSRQAAKHEDAKKEQHDTQNQKNTAAAASFKEKPTPQRQHIKFDSGGAQENETQKQQQEEVERLLGEMGKGSGGKTSTTGTGAGTGTASLPSAQAGKQIISSLFTKNPEIPKLARDGGQELRVSSNAAGDASFAGLGLDPDIVGFLSSKMEISNPTAIQTNAIPVLLGNDQAAQDGETGGDDDAFNFESSMKVEHDVFIQAATGSGKTLSYLLPIVHRILRATQTATSGGPASRELGTFAVILTPTRELAQQVYETTQTLVNMTVGQGAGGKKRLHWMVPGIVIGGDSKQSEKARLRKGVTILACTPGRLLDHLENTQAFCVDNLRWLVLDEADRLLELGFEDTLRKILALFEERAGQRRRVLGHSSVATSLELPRRRINVLCSATLRDNVRRLADEALVNPKFVSATSVYDNAEQAAEAARSRKRDRLMAEDIEDGRVGKRAHAYDGEDEDGEAQDGDEGQGDFAVPSQLVQKAVIVPAKLRLVTLVALLKNTLRQQPTSKIIVFLSCKDAVDFMYFMLSHGATQADGEQAGEGEAEFADDLFNTEEDAGDKGDDAGDSKKSRSHRPSGGRGGPQLTATDIHLQSNVFPGVKMFRLHGSMQQKQRTETFLAFSREQHASVLFTTDVAARGLDLPNVTSIVQYDAPTDLASYLHRVGRTARLGRVGHAHLFLLPSEAAYLTVLSERGLRPQDESVEAILRLAAKSEGTRRAAEWQLRAAEWQLVLERFVLSNITAMRLAKQAFLSSIRAYATHGASEKRIFHVRFLHFGHLAKAFALRETPAQVAEGKGNNQKAVEVKREKRVRREREEKERKKPRFVKGNEISEFAVGDVSAYYGPRVRRGAGAGSDDDSD
ncbi:ATP-dependent RNA helicase dbp7 [Coemansia interrupta]|uniref:ATP-dependent RNA helicase n=1 Tax=Coemansia interrupta TaxID=1126814 RepID=A0A9W8HD53_9FUNG|nr:ATP-dependent RNA helicase dbp7 [Coemansia interrupta]